MTHLLSRRRRLILWMTLFVFSSSLAGPVIAQELVINEVMSSNGEMLFDEDGDTPDWIEFYNAGNAELNLEGYGLSDGANPFKWVFPETILPATHSLVVFASDKDRRDAALHWEAVIDWGDEWRYLVPSVEPPSSWRGLGFDDQNWSVGPTGIGYGDDDDATDVGRETLSVYLRKTFWIDDLDLVSHVFLDVDFDDGFVAYLNGVEIARENIGVVGTPPAYNESATRSAEGRISRGNPPVHYPVEDFAPLLNPGDNVLAIQVHNTSIASSDLTMIPFLTLGMREKPAEPRSPAEMLSSFFPRLHTNFKIDSDGETLTLTAPNGDPLDTLESGRIPTDISLGRSPDGSPTWLYFEDPTPGAANGATGYPAVASDPVFSHPGGFYSDELTLTLTTDDPSETIIYSLDGSDPLDRSEVYQSAISITETTVVRARVEKADALPGRTITHTFFVDESPTLPVISISTTPENFFDNDFGIYVRGDNAQAAFPHFGSNFWEDWERPVHVEFFEPDGTLGFSLGAGVKIFGGWSRGFPQKSLSIFARKEYGASSINYRIFKEKKIDRFEAIVLRNSGNDWDRTLMRDAMMTSLLPPGLDRQAYRPALMFLNGEYWGIHNIREKVNEHFVASNHSGVDPEELDLLEGRSSVIEGSNRHYTDLLNFMTQNDLSIPENYQTVQGLMDTENFMDYQAGQIYFDNQDWPGNNLKYWRPQTPEGMWRWITFDTDFGFGIWNSGAYSFNTLAFALAPNGPNWPNPPWSTFLLRTLVRNDRFELDFINRFLTRLNTIYDAGPVIARIDQMSDAVAPEMARQLRRWSQGSVSGWRSRVSVMRTFASRRVAYVRNHLRQEFGLSASDAELELQVYPPGSGSISIHGIELTEFPFDGEYPEDHPIDISAVPYPGYSFTGWQGLSPAEEADVTVTLDDDLAATASFEIDCSGTSSVVINEINYRSADDFNPGDWVEFYNTTATALDLSGWTFRDESDEHVFTFPENTILGPGEYLVLCADVGLFTAAFPEVDNLIGELGFGLSGDGELVRLLDDSESEVDSLTYNDAVPWPQEADGLGSTLALKNPHLENSFPLHWASSEAHGTPGSANDALVEGGSHCGEDSVRFLRGNCNGDDEYDIADAMFFLYFQFAGGDQPPCVEACDSNRDDLLDVADPILTLRYLFADGQPPALPFPACESAPIAECGLEACP